MCDFMIQIYRNFQKIPISANKKTTKRIFSAVFDVISKMYKKYKFYKI